MRIVITLFGVMLILMMFGGMLAAIHAFRGQDFTEPHIVVTASGQTSATVTLAAAVMDGDNDQRRQNTSNPADAPVPFSYDNANNQLTVTGLNLKRYPDTDHYLPGSTVRRFYRYRGQVNAGLYHHGGNLRCWRLYLFGIQAR